MGDTIYVYRMFADGYSLRILGTYINKIYCSEFSYMNWIFLTYIRDQ
jgi:hypothetical protein